MKIRKMMLAGAIAALSLSTISCDSGASDYSSNFQLSPDFNPSDPADLWRAADQMEQEAAEWETQYGDGVRSGPHRRSGNNSYATPTYEDPTTKILKQDQARRDLESDQRDLYDAWKAENNIP